MWVYMPLEVYNCEINLSQGYILLFMISVYKFMHVHSIMLLVCAFKLLHPTFTVCYIHLYLCMIYWYDVHLALLLAIYVIKQVTHF